MYGVFRQRKEWCVDVARVERMFFGKYCLVSRDLDAKDAVGNLGICLH